MARNIYIHKVFAALIILPFLNAQKLNMFLPNQTYSDIVCHKVSRGTKSQVIRETQCARCYRDDPSCVAFHYSEKDRTCHFYNLTVFGAIFEELCEDAPGFKFYMQGNMYSVDIQQGIMITCPCKEYPIIPHFYIVKLGFKGVYIFSYFFKKHELKRF